MLYNGGNSITNSLVKMKGGVVDLKIRLKNSSKFDEILIRRGYSRRAFAKQAGIGESTIIQICNYDRNPSPRTAKRICETLEIDFDDFFEIVNPQAVSN